MDPTLVTVLLGLCLLVLAEGIIYAHIKLSRLNWRVAWLVGQSGRQRTALRRAGLLPDDDDSGDDERGAPRHHRAEDLEPAEPQRDEQPAAERDDGGRVSPADVPTEPQPVTAPDTVPEAEAVSATDDPWLAEQLWQLREQVAAAHASYRPGADPEDRVR